MFKQIAKALKGKLDKSGLQERLEKYPNYLVKAKETLVMINEDLGISDTIENKLVPKVDKFEKAVLAKLPQITKKDVTELRQSIVGKINEGKDAVLSKVDNLKQLQDFNTKLQEENEKLKNQLSKFESLDTSNTVSVSNEEAKTTIAEDVKQENEQS
jgi:hypothetical protein